jgi:hypothetical protein
MAFLGSLVAYRERLFFLRVFPFPIEMGDSIACISTLEFSKAYIVLMIPEGKGSCQSLSHSGSSPDEVLNKYRDVR